MTTALALAEPTSDPESLDWVRVLTATGRVHDDAVERLHALMLRAARFEVSRRTAGFAPGSDDLDDLAMRAADDALVALLNKLHTYRGDSRLTTWAYKFALLEAGVKVRRRPWHGREVTLDEDGLARLPSHERASPAQEVETFELLDAVRGAITQALTPQQREVLAAVTLNDVPIDVLAKRRGTTRGALYKTLHDARRKLRIKLAAEGLEAP